MDVKNIVLLKDERREDILDLDWQERILLVKTIEKLPIECLSKLRHLQPQVGCLNSCSICDRNSNQITEYWTENQLRNIISAIKTIAIKYRTEPPFVAWEGKVHRRGTISIYNDNDVGYYPYLDKMIKLLTENLGVRVKISTVGFSRHNKELNEMHKSICNNYLNAIKSLRLSFTPYAVGWTNDKDFNRKEYEDDMSNFLSTYSLAYQKSLNKEINFQIVFRLKGFVSQAEIIEDIIDNKYCIICGNYGLIADDFDGSFEICDIDMDKVKPNVQDDNLEAFLVLKSLKLFLKDDIIKGKHVKFKKYIISSRIKKDLTLNKFIECIKNESGITFIKYSDVYKFRNKEGQYYAVDPIDSCEGGSGLNIFPNTPLRKKSGFLEAERVFLNAILKCKKESLLENTKEYSYEDVQKVLDNIQERALFYSKIGYDEYAKFINNEVLPIVLMYANALKKSNYPANLFFDLSRSCDSGIISNIGRAFSEFKSITNLSNEPIAPFHASNFGNISSVKTKDLEVWDICCAMGNKIVFSKPNSKAFEADNYINESLINYNVRLDKSILKDVCLLPGQIKKG